MLPLDVKRIGGIAGHSAKVSGPDQEEVLEEGMGDMISVPFPPIPVGTKEGVRALVNRLHIAQCRGGGRYSAPCSGPSNRLEPTNPPENVSLDRLDRV